MKKFYYILSATIISVFLTGCINVNTKVLVNNDGSGTIEETVLMKSEVVQMFRDFASSFSDSSSEQEEFNLFNEAELKAKASNYGEGVTYKKGEIINEDGWEGFKVYYDFNDINKITINPGPEDNVDLGEEASLDTVEENDEDFLTFNFEKGDPSTLTIISAKKEFDPKKDSTEVIEDTTGQQFDDQMLNILDGLKFSAEVEVNGKIVNTNASYTEGSKITLIDIDFSKLIKQKDVLEKLKTQNPETLDELKKLAKDVDGLKVEFEDRVKISFY